MEFNYPVMNMIHDI